VWAKKASVWGKLSELQIKKPTLSKLKRAYSDPGGIIFIHSNHLLPPLLHVFWIQAKQEAKWTFVLKVFDYK
jgi:hypothetical protein